MLIADNTKAPSYRSRDGSGILEGDSSGDLGTEVPSGVQEQSLDMGFGDKVPRWRRSCANYTNYGGVLWKKAKQLLRSDGRREGVHRKSTTPPGSATDKI